MPPPLDKVTAFITRQSSLGLQLLLLRHPFAGFQFPAGTLYVFIVSLSAFGAQTNYKFTFDRLLAYLVNN